MNSLVYSCRDDRNTQYLVRNVYDLTSCSRLATHPTIATSRSMVNDESKFPNARKFMPERFLSPEGKFNGGDINNIIAFGFGRRYV